MNRTFSIIFLSLLIFSSQVSAWNTLTIDIDIDCQHTDKKLDCEYRLLNDITDSSVNASSNEIKLTIANKAQYPQSSDVTAVLFLVDTSDPARQNVIEKNKAHIKEILATLKPHHKAGLASFDKSLKIQSPVGTSAFLLSKSIDSLTASGKTTELYRNLLKAIEHISSFDAQRRVIVLLSDGQAEDKAYFHSDVIKMARKHDVIINSIGYPRSVSLSVALQTIRRLSEETGGKYLETDTTYNLTNQNSNDLFKNIDSGGTFSVVLDELYKNNSSKNSVTLSFTTNSGSTKRIQVPVTINVEKPIVKEKDSVPIKKTVAEQALTNTSTPVNAPIQIITKQAETQPINLWIWYGLPAAFIIIIIFILITLYLLWRKPVQQVVSTKDDYKPFAYLIANDGSERRYPITRTICRIGRSKDNELSLDDTSISRRHAEIHRNSDGTFDIIDMNSMNGVYVNNEKVGKAELHEGDILEIGDFFLHFTQLASDHSLEESTVMQKTRTPTH